MNRKNFLSSLLTTGAAFPLSKLNMGNREMSDKPSSIPPYLKSGDTNEITCPACNTTQWEIQPAIQQIES